MTARPLPGTRIAPFPAKPPPPPPPGPPPTTAAAAALTGWHGPLFLAAGFGVLAGAAAVLTEGPLRRAALLLLLLSGFAMAAVVARRVPGHPEAVMGGAGYQPPGSRVLRVLHAVLSLAHNAGIMVVVFAALVRADLLPLDLPVQLLRVFPAILGVYVLALAVATKRRIDEQGGVLRTWATRSHGWFLALVGTPIALLGAALVAMPLVEIPGILVLAEADLQVLVLVGILGVGTQLFLAVHLPTLFDLVYGLTRILSAPSTGRGTPPVVYALVLSVALTTVVGFVLARFDLLRHLGGFRDERVGILLVLLPVTLALFLLVSALQIWREGRRGLYRRRMAATLRQDLLVYGFSAAAGLALTWLLVLNLLGRIDSIGPLDGGRGLSKDLIVLTIVATAGPIGWHLSRRSRRIDAIEGRLPDFLNDLAETRRAGLTLAASLQSCSLSDYGALTPEIRKMANQVSWGIPFTEALRQFAERVRTNLVRRSVHLIIEASKTGGSVAEILKAAARDAYEIKAIESDRRSSMMTYLIVLYVVYFVFLVVIAVLDVRFLPEVLRAHEVAQGLSSQGVEGAPIGGGDLDADAIRFTFFSAAIVQAIGNGIVGGVLMEGRVSAGFRHVAILALSAWLLFRFLG